MVISCKGLSRIIDATSDFEVVPYLSVALRPSPVQYPQFIGPHTLILTIPRRLWLYAYFKNHWFDHMLNFAGNMRSTERNGRRCFNFMRIRMASRYPKFRFLRNFECILFYCWEITGFEW